MNVSVWPHPHRDGEPGALCDHEIRGGNLTRYMAFELGSRGITVNCVAPGAIASDFSGGVVRDNPQVAQAVANMTALGRPGLPEDIGPMIASLLSG